MIIDLSRPPANTGTMITTISRVQAVHDDYDADDYQYDRLNSIFYIKSTEISPNAFVLHRDIIRLRKIYSC